MPIRDAITRASSEHHVYFLVASYIENLAHWMPDGALPLRLAALPINGVDDLRCRRDVARAVLTMFVRGQDGAYSAMRECHDLFDAAVERICALHQASMASPA